MTNQQDQKDIFLDSEADAWYQRNQQAIAAQDYQNTDAISVTIKDLLSSDEFKGRKNINILEVGCGEARRLAYLAKTFDVKVWGVEPSALAVAKAVERGVKASQGTADLLPFDTASMDIVVYGFCLYLCDRQDLFKIAHEAYRVLKPSAWLVVNDFFAIVPAKREYHHRAGVFTYKMDYRKLFDWHPDITCLSHRVTGHVGNQFVDDPQEWVALSVLRKKSGQP